MTMSHAASHTTSCHNQPEGVLTDGRTDVHHILSVCVLVAEDRRSLCVIKSTSEYVLGPSKVAQKESDAYIRVLSVPVHANCKK